MLQKVPSHALKMYFLLQKNGGPNDVVTVLTSC